MAVASRNGLALLLDMNTRRFVSCFLAFASLFLASLWAAGTRPFPAAAQKPVVNEYQGTKVEDDYQWLENDQDPAVQAWSEAENQRTRDYLDHLPFHAQLEKQLQDWYAKTSPSYFSII